jgi:hypothetical protein
MTTQIIKINGAYQVTFTQGVQTFGINNVGTNKECKWVKKMLDKALAEIRGIETLTDSDIEAWAKENKKYMTSMGSAILGAKAMRDNEIKHIK